MGRVVLGAARRRAARARRGGVGPRKGRRQRRRGRGPPKRRRGLDQRARRGRRHGARDGGAAGRVVGAVVAKRARRRRCPHGGPAKLRGRLDLDFDAVFGRGGIRQHGRIVPQDASRRRVRRRPRGESGGARRCRAARAGARRRAAQAAPLGRVQHRRQARRRAVPRVPVGQRCRRGQAPLFEKRRRRARVVRRGGLQARRRRFEDRRRPPPRGRRRAPGARQGLGRRLGPRAPSVGSARQGLARRLGPLAATVRGMGTYLHDDYGSRGSAGTKEPVQPPGPRRASRGRGEGELLLDEFCVCGTRGEEVLVRPRVCDGALVDHEDDVRVDHRR
mmetsp:Transcript_11102/g.38573  ORF Transcript_11102/g.38573 Transcript_11102/m.38573 type:complete len:333 (-) Transcript_11102:80-1078(-)